MRTTRWWPWVRRSGLLIGGGLFVWQLWWAGQAAVESRLSSATWAGLLIGQVPILLATALQITAWRAMMAAAGVPLRWDQALTSYMLPFVARFIPGTIWGYLGRSEWLARHHHVSPAVSNGIAVSETVSILLTGAGLMGLAGVLNGDRLLWGAGALAVGGYGLGWLLLRVLADRPFWQTSGLARWRVQDWISQLSPRIVLAGAGWHAGMWIGYGLGLWWSTGVLGVGWSASAVPPVIGAYALAYTIGFLIIPLPSGLGLRDLSLVVLLQRTLAMSPDAAAVAAVVMRGFLLASELVYLVYAALTERGRRVRLKPVGGRSEN